MGVWAVIPDVPVGTFAARTSTFLPSRSGSAPSPGADGTSALSKTDLDFLEGLDFHDIGQLRRYARQLNAIYQKLGLLIRYSTSGTRYFLIPINLVAHSLQDIKTKADEIERFVIQHILEARMESLDIGLMTAANDLMVHELTARFSSHRIFLFETLAKLRTWRTPLDVIILPKDPFAYMLEQPLARTTFGARSLNRRQLQNHVFYLLGKIHDILEENGRFLLAANAPCPSSDQPSQVRFKSDPELKRFLFFTHVFKTKKAYPATRFDNAIELCDLYDYLNNSPFAESYGKRLLNQHKIEELDLEGMEELPFLNLRPRQTYVKNLESTLEQAWPLISDPGSLLQSAGELSAALAGTPGTGPGAARKPAVLCGPAATTDGDAAGSGTAGPQLRDDGLQPAAGGGISQHLPLCSGCSASPQANPSEDLRHLAGIGAQPPRQPFPSTSSTLRWLQCRPQADASDSQA
jgi:hypothetical protein